MGVEQVLYSRRLHRDREYGTRDHGVLLFDRIILREMAKVERGLAPLGTGYGPEGIVDTNLEAVHAIGLR